MKVKYTDDALKRELIRVFDINKIIPLESEWANFSHIRSDTIKRRLGGSWSSAWNSVGISIAHITKNIKRNTIIDTIKQTYIDNKDSIHSCMKLLKLSGYSRQTIYKYFESMESVLSMSNIVLNNNVSKSDAISDVERIKSIVNGYITKKDISVYGKYKLSTYIKKIGTIKEINNVINSDYKDRVSKDELLNNLIEIYKSIGRVPTNKDLVSNSKFSQNAYRREFGGLKEALKYAGIIKHKTKSSSKIESECKICNHKTKNIIAHMKKLHKYEFDTYNEKIIDLYKNGHSAMSIALMPESIYSGATSVLRMINSFLSKDEIDELRKKKISKTLKDKYIDNTLDWVSEINKSKNTDVDFCKNVSSGNKKSYSLGRCAWNSGCSKDTDARIHGAAKKISNTIKSMYNDGQMQRKIGRENHLWKKDRDIVTKRYRIGAGFTKNDRALIINRANNKCEICGTSPIDGTSLECDHVLPIKFGGTDNWKLNGQALCSDCHKNKTFKKNFCKFYGSIDDIKYLANDILLFNGNRLTDKYIKSLSYKEKVNLSYCLLDFFSKYDFMSCHYDEETISGDIKSLISLKCVVKDKVISNKLNSGLKICRHYCPNVIKIKNKNKKSVFDILNDNELLLYVIRNRLGFESNGGFSECFNIRPSTILWGAKNSLMASRGSIFKPYTAKIIYDHWTKSGDSVYDFSMGFGGRMIGCHAVSKNLKYIGCDPNSETFAGLMKMKSDLDINADIYNECSENFVPNNINFAFSSPPYFNYETYCDEETQSYIKYKDYDEWLEKYWRSTVRNIHMGLCDDGIFGVNVGNDSNKFMSKIMQDTTDIIQSEGFELIDTWYMESRTIKNTQKLEGIYFYKKINYKNNNITMNSEQTNYNCCISNKIDCHDDEIIVYNGTPLTSRYIKTLTVDERTVIADELFLYFSKKDLSKTIIDISKVNNEFVKLQQKNIPIVNDTIKNILSTGSYIYKYFLPNILNTRNSKNESVAKILSNKDNLKAIIRNRLGLGYKETFNITTNMIRQGAKSTGLAFHGSQFKPLVAKAIYSKYVKENDNVLDYSCGFGSRLLGLMALQKNNKYFGYEPNTDTYNNLLKMSEHFKFNVDIKCCGSEDEIFEEKMNFVFSSPPYFNTEIYCDEATQCYNKFPQYNDWLEKYWRQTVINIKKMMASGAVFGVNIGNSANENMIMMAKDLNSIVVSEGFTLIDTLEMHTPISHLANKKNKNVKLKQEYIYFYRLE